MFNLAQQENDLPERSILIMSKSDITKRVIAAALKELMNDTPFNEISVNNIVERIGINRKTFYYHY